MKSVEIPFQDNDWYYEKINDVEFAIKLAKKIKSFIHHIDNK